MKKNKKNSFLVVVTGPPASGKDTLVEKLLEHKSLRLQRVVTYNTRRPRRGEIHGVHHHFVSVEEFQQIRKKGLMLEHVRTGSSWKGTPKEPFEKIIRTSENYVWRIDPSRSANLDTFFLKKFGVTQGQRLYEKTALIYITVKNIQLLKERFKLRDSNQSIKDFHQRLEKDLAIYERYKHKFPHVVFNDQTIEKTVQEVVEIIKTRFLTF